MEALVKELLANKVKLDAALATLEATAKEITDRYSKKQAAEVAQEVGAVTVEFSQKVTKSAWAALTSEKAQHIYKSIVVAVALIAAVIGIGLYKAARYYWAEYGQQPTFRVYKSARRRARIAQWQLSRWIKQAFRRGRNRAAFEWQTLIDMVVTGWQGV